MIRSTALIAIAVGAAALAACAPRQAPPGGSVIPPPPTTCADTGVLEIAGAPAYRVCSVDKPVLPRPGNPVPDYPPNVVEAAPVSASVLIRFVVNTAGVIELGTVQVLESTGPAFTWAVTDVLARLRFSPAERDGRYVRQQVEMAFRFSK